MINPETEEEAIRIINNLRIQTSKPGQAILIDISTPLHMIPLRSEEDYQSEISWRVAILDTACVRYRE